MNHLPLDLQEQAHQIGRDVLAVHADDVDQHSRFPKESMDALKQAGWLSAYVPRDFGGLALNLPQIAEICDILGHYCGSTAMIFAMHQIQVACIVHHHRKRGFFVEYLRRLVREQRLIASATTEIGVGGDLRSSICAVETDGDRFRITKKAPVISYGEDADDLILTARRNPEAPKSDQVHVLLLDGQYQLEQIGTWDALGFRGTRSDGYIVTGEAPTEQILPTPFADILSQTMHPFAHITWSSLWAGIAADAVDKARRFVKKEAKRNLDMPPISAIRLGEVDTILQTLRHNIGQCMEEYQRMIDEDDANAFTQFGFGIRINNLKISSSELIVDIVGKAMLICGISGYRNDSEFSLCRHIRDAYGAALMVNNDRIMLHNATLLLMHKDR